MVARVVVVPRRVSTGFVVDLRRCRPGGRPRRRNRGLGPGRRIATAPPGEHHRQDHAAHGRRRDGRCEHGLPHGVGGYPCPAMATHLEEQLKRASGEARRLPLPRRARRGALHRQGEVAAAARALVLPGQRRTRARRSQQLPERVADVEVIVTRHRGRGAAPGAEPRQASPAAVQRPAARRQVVPVHRGHGRGRLPASDVHARAAPARGRLLRPVREREEGARDARRAQPRLPVPALRGPEARPPLAGSRASTTTSSAAWRRASATSRRRTTAQIIDGVIEFLSGETRPIQRELERKMTDAADGRALRGGGALSQPAVRGAAPGRAAGGRPALGRQRRRDRARRRGRPRGGSDLPAA